MSVVQSLGICMDHANAHLIEFTAERQETRTIPSKFTHNEKGDSLAKSEHTMHNKEQHLQSDYYKHLGDIIKQYDEVLLFGPTNAKSELYNLLKDDHLFEKIKIEVKQSDKMTDNQQHAYVRDYFSRK